MGHDALGFGKVELHSVQSLALVGRGESLALVIVLRDVASIIAIFKRVDDD